MLTVGGAGRRVGVAGVALRLEHQQHGGALAAALHLALGIRIAQHDEPVGEALLGGALVALGGLAGDLADGVDELA